MSISVGGVSQPKEKHVPFSKEVACLGKKFDKLNSSKPEFETWAGIIII